MEYMHVNVRGGGNKPDALEEFGADKELRIAKKLVAMVARTERIYKEDGLRGLIADFAGRVDVEKVEVKDGKVTING